MERGLASYLGEGKLRIKEKIRYFSIIRVIGLLLVLIYHFFIEKLPGGFLGVDVFFTFSGYLITSLILNEIQVKGSFNLVLYLKKRFLRIFPALFLAIFLTLPFLNFISKDYIAGIDKQITSALGFVSNYFFILNGTSYEANLLPQIYIHTWSLALEMQFYLTQGTLIFLSCFIFSKISKNIKINLNIAFKTFLFIVFSWISVACYFSMQRLFSKDFSVAYFSSFSHGYSFFIGATLSLVFGLNLPNGVKKVLNKNSKTLILPSIFLAIVSTFFIIFIAINTSFKNQFTYKFAFLICSLLTCVLILCFRILHEIVPKNIKEPFVISHLAEISYLLYLFHWPFFIIFANVFSNRLIVALVTLMVSYVFSVLINYVLVKNKVFSVLSVVTFLAVLVLNINTLAKMPDIKEIEKEQIVSNIAQNLDYLSSINKSLDYMKVDPVLQKNGIKNFSNLDFNCKKEQQLNVEKNIKLTQNENKNLKSEADLLKPFKYSKVRIIGDSVALGARKALLENIPESFVDTKGSRSLEAGYSIIKEWQAQGEAAQFEYLVVALGTNGIPNASNYINKIINDLKPGQRLIFVTPFDGHWNESWFSFKTTEYLRSLENKYSYVTIADWAKVISPQKELLGSDKTHIGGNTAAIKLYVNTVLNGLNVAKSKEAKN